MAMEETSPDNQPALTPKVNPDTTPKKLTHRRWWTFSHKKLLVTAGVALLVLVGATVLFVLRDNKSVPTPAANALASTNPTNDAKSLFGTMLAYNINDGLTGSGTIDGLQKGWSVFRTDSAALQKYLTSLGQLYESRDKFIKDTKFSSDREIAGLFTWNVIEPQKGNFDWTLTDLAVQQARNARLKISAVIQPFAGWDQKNTPANPACRALDFAWYDYKSGPPNDWAEYQNFLDTTVKRYKDVVTDWEIGNEYDGQCGGYQNNPEGYLKLLQTSYQIIKKVDPAANVLNGGALETDMVEAENVKTFWTKFFELGGNQYLDKFNLHYNTERNGAKADASLFLANLTFFNNLMIKNGGAKPIWITEFGTYSGTPSSSGIPSSQVGSPGGEQQPGSAGQQVRGQASLPTQSENFQAAWYFKYSILAFANNTQRIFVDFIGPDNQNIGASSIYNNQFQSRLFFKTLRTISDNLSGFSRVEKIADGQYKFTVSGKTIYTLWSGTLPPEITGKVKVTDTKGQVQATDAAKIKFNADQPVLVSQA